MLCLGTGAELKPAKSKSGWLCALAFFASPHSRLHNWGLFWEALPQVPRPIAARGWAREFFTRAALCRAQRAAAPLPADLMSREVAGQPEGTTLLECIEAGSVAFPERMGYVH